MTVRWVAYCEDVCAELFDQHHVAPVIGLCETQSQAATGHALPPSRLAASIQCNAR